MELLPNRKGRLSLAVEPLEDRRLLSQFGSSPAWDPSARSIHPQGETAPMSGSSANLWGFGVAASGSALSPLGQVGSPWSEPAGHPGPEVGSIAIDCAPTTLASSLAMTGSGVVSAESFASPGLSLSNDLHASQPMANAQDLRGSESTTSGSMSPPALAPATLPPRTASGFSIARSPFSQVQTTSRVDLGADPAPPGRSVADETLLAVTSAVPGVAEAIASPDQARASVAINLPVGLGSVAGLVAPGGTLAAPHPSPSDLPRSAEISFDREIENEGTKTRLGEETRVEGHSPALFEVEAPEPSLADVIQGFLPIDRQMMESAFDRWLDPFDGLSATIPGLRGPMGLITASLAAAVTVVAVEVAIRLRQARERRREGEDVGSLASFSEI